MSKSAEETDNLRWEAILKCVTFPIQTKIKKTCMYLCGRKYLSHSFAHNTIICNHRVQLCCNQQKQFFNIKFMKPRLEQIDPWRLRKVCKVHEQGIDQSMGLLKRQIIIRDFSTICNSTRFLYDILNMGPSCDSYSTFTLISQNKLCAPVNPCKHLQSIV